MPQKRDFPYEDGDVTVLGPEIFASKGGAVISWRGENYVRPAEQDQTPHDLTPDALYELASAVRDLSSAIRLETTDRKVNVSVCDGPSPSDVASSVATGLRRMRQRPPQGGA